MIDDKQNKKRKIKSLKRRRESPFAQDIDTRCRTDHSIAVQPAP